MEEVLTKTFLKYNHQISRVTLLTNPKTLKSDTDAVVNPNLVGKGVNFTSPFLVGFPLITHKRRKLQSWHFAAFSKMLLERIAPNLVFLTFPSF